MPAIAIIVRAVITKDESTVDGMHAAEPVVNGTCPNGRKRIHDSRGLPFSANDRCLLVVEAGCPPRIAFLPLEVAEKIHNRQRSGLLFGQIRYGNTKSSMEVWA